MARRHGSEKRRRDPAAESFALGLHRLSRHPMFAPLVAHANVWRYETEGWQREGWAVVDSAGSIQAHPKRLAEPDEWVYVLAHCLLHLGFGHFAEGKRPEEWRVACDCVVARFLADLKLGTPPPELRGGVELPTETEEELYERFLDRGIPSGLRALCLAGYQGPDLRYPPGPAPLWRAKIDWRACFGQGLAMAVAGAVSVAGGHLPSLDADTHLLTPARRARDWFISSYPLLGALAAAFTLVEDPGICQRLDVSVAAVDDETKEIFLNPAAGLDDPECRFVLAHELLHVGLRHLARRQGRHPFVWNVACDYVINGWLVEMGLGEIPQVGALYDPTLKGESAEAIYDRLVTDMRRCRKLATLRGHCLGDMLERGRPAWWEQGAGVDLDEFYRRCLGQGLEYHQEGRGFLPAGLVEEIRALAQPPIPWDVELAQWFDEHFSPLEKRRTYARPSRRQASTPDIPRPRWVPDGAAEEGRTFGVVLDTSGSMDRALLAKALGSIASYSISRDVPSVRVVFCDAAAYDQGYLPPEAIADRVMVRGRGGTVLQPGIELLERAGDFPSDGPLLIITDGFCDRLHVRREHAYLVPEGHSLPFVPKGKVFRIR